MTEMTDETHWTPTELLRHTTAIRALALRLVGDEHLAEDVTQETLTRAWTADGVPIRRRTPWILGVARNVARQALRSSVRRRRWETAASGRGSAPPTDELVARGELAAQAVRHLLGMPEPYRRTLLLHFLDGLPAHEIAHLDGTPPATVRTRIHRGIAILRSELDAAEPRWRRTWARAFLGDAAHRSPDARDHTPTRSSGTRSGSAAPSAVTAGVLALSATKNMLVLATVAIAVAIGAIAWRTDDDPARKRADVLTVAEEPADEAVREHESATRARSPLAVDSTAVARDTPTTELPGGIQIVGRVVGDGRHPVSGAVVSVSSAGDDMQTTNTDTDGRFTLVAQFPESLGPDDRIAIHVTHVGGTGALVTAPPPDSEQLDIGTIILEPVSRLRIRVFADARPVPGATVALLAQGRHEPLHILTTVVLRQFANADGEVSIESLPLGDYIVQAYDSVGGRAVAAVGVGLAPASLDVTLSRRDIRVNVTQQPDGRPVVGADLHVEYVLSTGRDNFRLPVVPPLAIPPTDDDGRTVIAGLSSTVSVTVHLRKPAVGEHSWTLPMALLPRDVTHASIDVPDAASHRWRILPGETRSPEHGTALRLLPARAQAPLPASAKATVQNGHVVLEGLGTSGSAHVFVLHGDAIAALDVTRKGGATGTVQFHPTRQLDVRVVSMRGAPLAGERVALRRHLDQGRWGPRLPAIAVTDNEGVARLGSLPPEVYDILLLGDAPAALDVGTADLRTHNGSATVVVPPSRTTTLQIRLDGVPGLPSEIRFGQAWIHIIAEDPMNGTLDIVARPPSPDADMTVHLLARGYTPATFTLPPAPAKRIGVDLTSGAHVTGRVLSPTDGNMTISLETLGPSGRIWQPAAPGRALHLGPAGRVSIVGLLPGRYRLKDTESGLVTIAVEAAAGATTDLGVLDLSRATWLRGIVEFPDGIAADDVVLSVHGERIDRPIRRREYGQDRVRPDGRFAVRIPGSVPVTIRAEHPLLQTASVDVDGRGSAEAPTVLRLERARVVSAEADASRTGEDVEPNTRSSE